MIVGFSRGADYFFEWMVADIVKIFLAFVARKGSSLCSQ
jgi:hypothetical protein